MAIFVKSLNCLCSTCGTDPCIAELCFCDLTLNTAGGSAGYDETFNVTGDFTAARNIYIDFNSFTVKDQLLIYANGSLIYDSGCISGNVTPTVNVPSGTTSARVVVVPDCASMGVTAWTLDIDCA
jgi:hypothetical protein